MCLLSGLVVFGVVCGGMGFRLCVCWGEGALRLCFGVVGVRCVCAWGWCRVFWWVVWWRGGPVGSSFGAGRRGSAYLVGV